ncbi:hypothetical protein B0H17DRAFT_1093040 [Mycena rosella]|uniref:Uncharacterized protein n=1 Tax=Mycena rosella TaxID=1033263 RepID=A0AAD7G7D6_MYCRO|nr:hypothetical protein B0H17DRAFT_1093040 [Mycena rosella]
MLDSLIDHHIRKFPLTSISTLSPYTGLIISVVLLVFFLIKFYVLELFLLRRFYGAKYTDLDEINRRSFVNHHIAGGTKIIILIIAVYPFGDVAFGTAGFHTPVMQGSNVTMGDMLVISSQMLVGMFIFELIYRTKISPISVVRGRSLRYTEFNLNLGAPYGEHFGGASRHYHQYFSAAGLQHRISPLYCMGWFLPHLTIILYRVYPDSHHFLATLFRVACFTTLVGTTAETIVAMYLFGQLWSRWTLSFKIATPILHVAFSAAQFHGTRIFYRMWKKQERIIRDQPDEEKGTDVDSVDSEERGTTEE